MPFQNTFQDLVTMKKKTSLGIFSSTLIKSCSDWSHHTNNEHNFSLSKKLQKFWSQTTVNLKLKRDVLLSKTTLTVHILVTWPDRLLILSDIQHTKIYRKSLFCDQHVRVPEALSSPTATYVPYKQKFTEALTGLSLTFLYISINRYIHNKSSYTKQVSQ